jgi:hypothetical protein
MQVRVKMIDAGRGAKGNHTLLLVSFEAVSSGFVALDLP